MVEVFSVGYDAGGGGDYHPVPPVSVLDEAVTFLESEVTVTRNNVTSPGADSTGSLWIQANLDEDFEDDDITTPKGWNGWNGDTGSFTAQTGTVLSGSYSGELHSLNEQTQARTRTNEDQPYDTVSFFRDDNYSGGWNSNGDWVGIGLTNTSWITCGELRWRDNENDVDTE